MPERPGTRECIVRLRPVTSNALSLIFLALCVFGFISLQVGSSDSFGPLSPGLSSGLVVAGGLLVLALSVDSVTRRHCVVERVGSEVIVAMPFRLDRVVRGHRFDQPTHPNLRVVLRTDPSNSSMVIVTVSDRAELLSRVRYPFLHLDHESRARVDGPSWNFETRWGRADAHEG